MLIQQMEAGALIYSTSSKTRRAVGGGFGYEMTYLSMLHIIRLITIYVAHVYCLFYELVICFWVNNVNSAVGQCKVEPFRRLDWDQAFEKESYFGWE